MTNPNKGPGREGRPLPTVCGSKKNARKWPGRIGFPLKMPEKKLRVVIPIHPGKDIKPKTLKGIIDDLGASSLDMFDLLTDLEEAFKIDIDDEANQIETVADAIKYIKSKT